LAAVPVREATAEVQRCTKSAAHRPPPGAWRLQAIAVEEFLALDERAAIGAITPDRIREPAWAAHPSRNDAMRPERMRWIGLARIDAAPTAPG
jgi:hypothetical protein